MSWQNKTPIKTYKAKPKPRTHDEFYINGTLEIANAKISKSGDWMNLWVFKSFTKKDNTQGMVYRTIILHKNFCIKYNLDTSAQDQLLWNKKAYKLIEIKFLPLQVSHKDDYGVSYTIFVDGKNPNIKVGKGEKINFAEPAPIVESTKEEEFQIDDSMFE